MNRVKKTVRLLAVMVMVCMMLATTVFAADEGSVWLNAVQNEEQTDAYIVTDTAVADGLVELTHDAESMDYLSVEVNEEYVAMYSMNAEEDGTVKIAWVAPADVMPEENQWLFKVTFAGTGDVTMSGSFNGGETAELAVLDVSKLEMAILEAEGLYEDNYTNRSWKTLEKALKLAKEVLADTTADQKQVNAAAETLNNGIASLELRLVTNNVKLYTAILRAEGLKKDMYTAESWADLQAALKNAKVVNLNRRATQKQVDEATKALNEAIAALELKPVEPTVPEEPTKPEKPSNPVNPGVVGKWLEGIRKILGKWFGWGK